MVARHPEQPGEAVGEDAEGEAEMLLGLADVARQDQPVVGVRPQGPQGLPGHLVAEVQVGDRIELHQVSSWIS